MHPHIYANMRYARLPRCRHAKNQCTLKERDNKKRERANKTRERANKKKEREKKLYKKKEGEVERLEKKCRREEMAKAGRRLLGKRKLQDRERSHLSFTPDLPDLDLHARLKNKW